MNCSNCKAEIDDDAKFCGFCGEKVELVEKYKVEESAPDNREENINEQEKPRQPKSTKKINPIVIVGNGLVIIILIIFGTQFFDNDSAESLKKEPQADKIELLEKQPKKLEEKKYDNQAQSSGNNSVNIEANIKKRLTQYYILLDAERLDKIIPYYTDPVSKWYGSENIRVSNIVKDARTYYSKWKFHTTKIDWTTLKITPKNGFYEAVYSMDYWVKQNYNDPYKYFRLTISAILIRGYQINAIGEKIIERKTVETLSREYGKYPQSSTRYLTVNDLSGLSNAELRIMRNEIFARNGYVFKTEAMSNYFNRIDWYRKIDKLNVNDDGSSLLTDIEKANIKIIQKYEAL